MSPKTFSFVFSPNEMAWVASTPPMGDEEGATDDRRKLLCSRPEDSGWGREDFSAVTHVVEKRIGRRLSGR